MSDNVALVDTNVLVYSLYHDSNHHAAATALLNRVQDGEIALCVTSQILTEFFAVITNPRRVTSPYSATEALDEIDKILVMPGVTTLSPAADIVPRWLDLARRYPVSGAGIFDVQLVATMLDSGINKVYTYNRQHFERFSEIQVLTP